MAFEKRLPADAAELTERRSRGRLLGALAVTGVLVGLVLLGTATILNGRATTECGVLPMPRGAATVQAHWVASRPGFDCVFDDLRGAVLGKNIGLLPGG